MQLDSDIWKRLEKYKERIISEEGNTILLDYLVGVLPDLRVWQRRLLTGDYD